jgi:hypothetical protein
MTLEEGLWRGLKEWESISNFDWMDYEEMAGKCVRNPSLGWMLGKGIAQLGLQELVTKTLPRELLTRALLLKLLLARRLLSTLPGLLGMHSLALPYPQPHWSME